MFGQKAANHTHRCMMKVGARSIRLRIAAGIESIGAENTVFRNPPKNFYFSRMHKTCTSFSEHTLTFNNGIIPLHIDFSLMM